MSQGRRFIQSVIRDEQPGALRLVGEHFFLEEELPLFEFVNTHHARYSRLPDDRVLREAGFSLPVLEDDQPVSYHSDRLRERYIFNVVNDSLPTITGGMQSQDMEVVEQALRDTLGRIGAASRGNTAQSLSDIVGDVIADYQIARRTTGLRGITMGWPSLDAITLGAQPGDLIVLVARPSIGKTNTLIYMANASAMMGDTDLFVSMEMGKLQIGRRWVGLFTGLNPNMIRAGRLSSWGLQILQEGIVAMNDMLGRVYLESGDFAREVGGIEAMILQFAPQAVYVDAAYLLTPDGQKRGYVTKWEQLSMVIGQLKQLALRYNIPIFITVQFNKNQKDTSSNMPDLGDIAGSDSIPQDASIVIALQKAPSPYEAVRRVAKMMKSREGELIDIMYNYRFEPVNFNEIPFDIGTEQAQEPAASLEWMV